MRKWFNWTILGLFLASLLGVTLTGQMSFVEALVVLAPLYVAIWGAGWIANYVVKMVSKISFFEPLLLRIIVGILSFLFAFSAISQIFKMILGGA